MNLPEDDMATRIVLERCKRKYEEKFRNLLLDRVGFLTYHKVLAKISPAKPENVSLDQLMRVVEEVKRSENIPPFETQAYRRDSFTRRHQKENESIFEYFKALKELIRSCIYSNEDERLRDQLIFGLKDTNLKAFALQNYSKFTFSEDLVRVLQGQNNPNASSSSRGALPPNYPPTVTIPARGTLPPVQNIPPRNTVTTIPMAMRPSQSDHIGIEGGQNSCYMDAALMALFLFENAFNGCLQLNHGNTHAWKNNGNYEIKRVLAEEVVAPLQRDKRLPLSSGAMLKLRGLLASVKPDYRHAQMDAEEFVSTLFETVLNSNHFYKIDGNGAGFVFQTFADMTTSRGKTSNVQLLLESSFHLSQVCLDEVPNPGFIVKLPVSNGKPAFEQVLPNLEISLGKVLLGGGANPKMLLSAVICLEGNHYSVFVRTGIEKYSPWIYLDSLTYPRIYQLPELGRILEGIGRNEQPTVNDENDKRKYVYLLRAAYMCIYVPEPCNNF